MTLAQILREAQNLERKKTLETADKEEAARQVEATQRVQKLYSRAATTLVESLSKFKARPYICFAVVCAVPWHEFQYGDPSRLITAIKSQDLEPLYLSMGEVLNEQHQKIGVFKHEKEVDGWSINAQLTHHYQASPSQGFFYNSRGHWLTSDDFSGQTLFAARWA